MKAYKPQLAILLVIAVLFLQACYCTSAIPNVVCMREDGTTYIWGLDDLWGRDECAEAGDVHVGETYDNPTAVPAQLPPNNGQNNIVAPSLNCNNLNLTSPTGLANGSNTLYWDGIPNANRYRVNIYDHTGAFLRSFDSQGNTTNLTADLSWGAIGGQYELRIEIVAFSASGASCSRSFTIQREAPSGGIPSAGGGGGNGGGGNGPAPTPTLTCAQDPRPDCIR